MFCYRKIQAADDDVLACIIRENLKKNHLDIPGTVYFDPELDHLSEYYNYEGTQRVYFVMTEDDRVIGGIGAAELSGIDHCAELQKLYLDDSAKGKGYSKLMINILEDWAKAAGYEYLYLETHSNLSIAMRLYEKMGYKQIDRPDFVVHSTMDHFYLKKL